MTVEDTWVIYWLRKVQRARVSTLDSDGGGVSDLKQHVKIANDPFVVD